MGSYQIVLVDDHVMFRQGLKRILEGRSDLEVVGEVDCGLELLKLLEKLVPDLIILDISMPNIRGLEAIPGIKMNHPKVKILVLTMHKDQAYLHQAITGGASGYLLKEDADSELFSAIDRIRQGRIYVSPILSEGLTDKWVRTSRGNPETAFEPEKLTIREREVLKLIAEGKSGREIGDLLFISARTVERHRANIMEKLNVKKIADLVKYAVQKGYV